MDDNDWKKLFGAGGRPESKEPCPRAGTVLTWAQGALPSDAVVHLAACPSCREELLVLRRPERVSVDLRNRLSAMRATPARGFGWIAAAAAILAIVATFFLLRPPEPTQAPPVAIPPNLKPASAHSEPRTEVPPPPPESPRPAPQPEQSAPPSVPPAPLPPRPEPPVVATPVPAPERPAPIAPAPEKPAAAPVPTRAALKGTLLAVSGSCSVQGEGEPAPQSLKPGQKRDFPGMIRLKADTAATKVAIGPVTYFVQRASELSILLQEGRTHVQLVRGEAFFDVTPGNGLFEVESPHAKVTVKGTRFLVATDKSETEVLLQRGSVEFAAGGQSVILSPGEHSAAAAGRTPSATQKADPARRLAWVRSLEDFLWIECEQMALQGGMVILPDVTASGGRAIGVKDPLKPGVDASAEIRAKHKQGVPYTVWIRLSWPHNVPSALSLSVGDHLRWTSKDVVSAQGWQWVRAGTVELSDDPFRIRLTDTKVGLRVDQVLVTSDPDFNPDTDKR